MDDPAYLCASGQVSHLGRTILSVPHAQISFRPCIPTKAAKVPDRPEWIHEIKHDGYRLIVHRRDELRSVRGGRG